MPKRTDISSILIIGAGPIVIGQACEFDYSGTQACKALKEEGYRIVLVNSNPATIMTDPGSGRRHLYRADHARDRRQDHRKGAARRPRRFALLPTMGGQTALNTALSLKKMGVLDKFDVEMIGATARSHRQGRGPRAVPRRDEPHRPGDAALAADQDADRRRSRRSRTSVCPRSSAPHSRSAAPAAASPTTRPSSSRSSSAASTPRRPARC